MNGITWSLYMSRDEFGFLNYDLGRMPDFALIALASECTRDMRIFSPVDPAWHGARLQRDEVLAELRSRSR